MTQGSRALPEFRSAGVCTNTTKSSHHPNFSHPFTFFLPRVTPLNHVLLLSLPGLRLYQPYKDSALEPVVRALSPAHRAGEAPSCLPKHLPKHRKASGIKCYYPRDVRNNCSKKIDKRTRKPSQNKTHPPPKREGKGKTKEGTDFFTKNLKIVLKLGGRGCLRSFPVFSLIITHSLASSRGLQLKWRLIGWDVGGGTLNEDIVIVSRDLITRHALHIFFFHCSPWEKQEMQIQIRSQGGQEEQPKSCQWSKSISKFPWNTRKSYAVIFTDQKLEKKPLKAFK